jgi:pimeloyl-ACP methyl ester carboxylesterase
VPRRPGAHQRFLCLNAVHPWQPRRRLPATAWRLAYQVPLAAPGLGEWIARDGRLLEAVLGRSMNAAAARAYVEPLRADTSVQTYRQFILREAPVRAAEVRGRRIELPVLVLFGRRDPAQDVRQLRGLRQYAPRSAIELVDASHWIVDERPDLVAERARALFA